MYSFTSRVRYSECDGNSDMTLSALVNYFQDCSTFHSESENVGMAYLEANHVAWILSYWHIGIERFPKLGEEISISTWVHEISRYMACRNFSIKDKDGQVIAYANSIWVYLDTEKGRLRKIDEDQKIAYKLEPAYPMEASSRKIEIETELIEKKSFKVPRFCIDTNNHVNNEKYILIAMEYIPGNSKIDSVRVEYKNPAVLGDMVYPYVGIDGNKITVLLANEEKKPYAIVEFLVS